LPKSKTRQSATPQSRPKARKQKVAEGIINGKTDSEIAQEVGISRSQVQRIKHQPETYFRLQQLLSPHREQIDRIIQKSLDAVEAGLSAALLTQIGTYMQQPDGTFTPDHRVRQLSVQNAIRLFDVAEPKTNIPLVATITLEQLEEMLAQGSVK